MNIQLATETVRTSLEADWDLMTTKHKTTLIESSFKSRAALGPMLDLIVSEENTSNCSCGQTAPKDMHADP